MAIDSENKRRSVQKIYFIPDGAINTEADRRHLIILYRGTELLISPKEIIDFISLVTKQLYFNSEITLSYNINSFITILEELLITNREIINLISLITKQLNITSKITLLDRINSNIIVLLNFNSNTILLSGVNYSIITKLLGLNSKIILLDNIKSSATVGDILLRSAIDG